AAESAGIAIASRAPEPPAPPPAADEPGKVLQFPILPSFTEAPTPERGSPAVVEAPGPGQRAPMVRPPTPLRNRYAVSGEMGGPAAVAVRPVLALRFTAGGAFPDGRPDVALATDEQLVRRHLLEIAVLYGRRQSMADDRTMTLDELEAVERRIVAH